MKSKFVCTEKKILWPEVVKEIKKRTGKDIAIAYAQNIYANRLQSKKMKNILVELIGEPEKV